MGDAQRKMRKDSEHVTTKNKAQRLKERTRGTKEVQDRKQFANWQ